MITFSLPMPDNLKATVTAQAKRAGVSLSQYLLSIVAAHAGSQAEAERHFAACAARSIPARALEILARAGQVQPPEPSGELPPDLPPQARPASRSRHTLPTPPIYASTPRQP